jgi:hypothetical protein
MFAFAACHVAAALSLSDMLAPFAPTPEPSKLHCLLQCKKTRHKGGFP